MRLRIVVDTNVLVSGLLSVEGSPARVIDLIQDTQVTLLVDERILHEYRMVLARPKFQRVIRPAQAEAILALCSVLGEYVVSRSLSVAQPDPDDVPFLEVAVAGRAHALVTGNLRDFPTVDVAMTFGLRILSPTDFLTFYEATGPNLDDCSDDPTRKRFH